MVVMERRLELRPERGGGSSDGKIQGRAFQAELSAKALKQEKPRAVPKP